MSKKKPVGKTTIVTHAQPELQAAIGASIDKLAASERVTKAELSFCSRSILEYLVLNGSTDIDCVNRLLGVCTPMNKIAATHYFNHFLPWVLNLETGMFGNMIKGDKAREKNHALVVDWMSKDDNDIWAWSAKNLELKPRQAFDERIELVVKQALNGLDATDTREAQEPITSAEIIAAVIKAGVSADDLMTAVDDATDDMPDGVPGAEVVAQSSDDSVNTTH